MTDTHLTPKQIPERARHWHSTQIEWRRHLHQYPELSTQEVKTTRYIKERLKELNIKVLPLDMPTGVLAEIKGGKTGPTVAIRSDIDALPVCEQTGLPFASKIEGKMHACGHDVHMATVMGTAAILAENRKQLAGNIRLIFQPAEEQPPGGARPMIKHGALKGVDTIFGLHVDPLIPIGKVGLRDGAMMAAVYDFDLVIKGKGGHAAQPHMAVDAIVTAAEVVSSLQTIVSRERGPMSPLVISLGRIEGGGARNVVADRVSIIGTARTLSDKMLKALPKMIRKTVGGVCKARGATFEMTEVANYPPLINTPAVNRLYQSAFGRMFGKSKVIQLDALLGGEDFACYLQKVPGAMFRLGIRNTAIKADKPWHSPEFIVDEEAIYYGTSLLVSATLDYLQSAHR